MKRVHQPENNRSIAGSSYDSSDEDDTRSFCYSPQDDDQRRRFCDLVALALASSRDHGSVQPQSATWDGDASDSESHPSLESDAEAELLDLFDEEDENESGCFVESEGSTSPSVDGSFESYDATVIQNRKLSLLSRQQRQQSLHERAFRETSSFYTNHANVVSPDLMIVVERLLKESCRSSPPEKTRDKKFDAQSDSHETKSSSLDVAHRSPSANAEKMDRQLETADEVSKNATVMDHLRKLVYKKYENSKPDRSETESIRSSILPLSPNLLSYRDAFRLSSSAQHKSPASVPVSPRTKQEGTLQNGSAGGIDATSTVPIVCESLVPSAANSDDDLQATKRRVPQVSVLHDKIHEVGNSSGDVLTDSLQATAAGRIRESNLALCSTSQPPTGGNKVTGMITRSMIRNSGKTLLKPKPPMKSRGRAQKQDGNTELRQPEPNSPGTFHSTVNPVAPTVPDAKVNTVNRGNHDKDLFSVSATAEQVGGETLVINIEPAPSINSQIDSARTA